MDERDGEVLIRAPIEVATSVGGASSTARRAFEQSHVLVAHIRAWVPCRATRAKELPMKSGPKHRRGALRATLVATGLGVAAVAVSADVTDAAPPAGCDNRNNNSVPKLLECVTVEGVREHQAAFQAIADANGGTRSSGTPGYDRTVDYAAAKLRAAGYDVTVQPFDFDFFDDNSTARQTSPTPTDYPVLSAQFDDPVLGSGSGPLTPVDVQIPPGAAPNSSSSGCEEGDFAGFPADGVALIQRGTCAFTLKALNAEAAGASAVILFNEGQPGRTGFIIPIGAAPGLTIPVVATDFATGEALFGDAAGGATQVTVTADFVLETRQAANILAETKNGNDGNVVMVGAHLDSVLDGPGINDNGSGAATILDVAEAMRKVKPTNTVRFALWGAEEFGLLGSEFYVNSLSDAQRSAIALYLNFDMIGSPNYVRFVYDGDGDIGPAGPPGSGAIEDLFTQFYADRGLASEPTAFDGRSDYGPFIADGVDIPAGGLFTGAEGIKTPGEVAVYGGTEGEQYDQCYHLACDTFQNVALDVLDLNADAVAFATFTYSESTASVTSAQAAAAGARSAVNAFETRDDRVEG
jgi:Zn-dependent M28 family amino/carboxypeptidase